MSFDIHSQLRKINPFSISKRCVDFIGERFALRLKLLGCFILMFVFTIRNTVAQEPETELRIRAGAVFGLNASQVDGDDFAGFHKLGINGGFIAYLPLSKKFFISTEILYTQKGSQSRSYPGIPLEYRLRLNYAEIPVLINFQEKSAINFGLGVAYGRILKVREFVDGYENIPTTFDATTADINEIEKNDFNVVVNGNYLFTRNFFLNVRFAYSFLSMGHLESSNFHNRGLYNSVLTFRLGWIF